MEQNKNFESGFIIKNIILLESNFSRINQVFFDNVNNELNINANVSVNDKTVTVEEIVNLRQLHDEQEQVKIRVRMVGVFELVGESEIKNLEEFGRINGASIIFPYIREHITNLSQKGSVGAIILPPVNFTKAIRK